MSVRGLFALFVLGFTAASPVKKWYPESVGANYFQTNGFDGNQLVASYILPDGRLVAGSAVWTAGNGSAGINDPAPFENHADPFYSSGSVIVSGEQVFAVNAGSDSVSVFDIDPLDPAQPQLNGTFSSGGEFPISLAASPDGKIVCVLNAGARNGFSCYGAGDDGWDHMSGWDRSFGLNLTTPPHGPVGNTPSQITFSSDMSSLIVAVKGQLPTDLNNPSGNMTGGWIATYNIGPNGTLAAEPVKRPAAIPFSINEDVDQKGVFFLSDVSSGFAAYNADADSAVVQGAIPAEGATCWAAQSALSKSFYVVDITGKSNITEISLDPTTLKQV
ncbi:hypothetical protein EHS25_002798 [Saitozyma podzolica]|uniref:Uncharacterized protein n=1 Tax=Saitozyma podzolica TaxID=1890683 RepID=A0A427YDI5_9TREE|nr:hypothetical protein EHS25_002798 [Saitozyma podzolica]